MEPEGSLLYLQVPATRSSLSQLHPVPTTPSNFLKIHLNIIFPSTSGSLQCPLSLRLPHQQPVHISLLPIRATCPAHLILLDFTPPHNIV
jgi:hypothetical protein